MSFLLPLHPAGGDADVYLPLSLAVFYFRWIMHNYSTPYAVKILKNLVPALKPGTRIIINDHCLREPGQENPWDEKIMRRMDMVMLALLNAQERTEAEFRELFRMADEGFVFKVSQAIPLFLLLVEEPGGGGDARASLLEMCSCPLTHIPVCQGVTRPNGCRMSIIEAVWQGDDNASEPAGEHEAQKE